MILKPKMLLFSHLSNPTSITGAEKLLLFFCRELLPYFDCVLVVPGEGRLTALARQSGIQVRIFPLPLLYSIYTPSPGLNKEAARLKDKPLYRKLLRFIMRESPGVILTNTCVHYLPAAAGKDLGIPVVWKLTEMMTDNGHLNESTALIDRHSDWILSISESVAQGFNPGIRQSKVSVLYPSWNEAELRREAWPELRNAYRSELGIGPGTPLIGVVSSFLVENKGILDFIDMALDVKDSYPDARFLIVGSVLHEDYHMRCTSKIAAAGAEDRVIFAGCQDDIERVYCALDIIVVPSLVGEGFGLTAMEGLALEKPVIAYASGGLKELLDAAGCSHMLAEPGNPGSLSEKLRSLLDDPELGRSLGEQNRGSALAALGPDMYRMRLHELVTRWQGERPGWFHTPVRRAVSRHTVSGRQRSRKSRAGRRVRSIAVRRTPRRSRLTSRSRKA
ncbi:glycosyltransferase [Paenibacillus lemnae]|uniref:Glycosyltransferase n=1 Tax=Paenibacillus lemnae TaxID=1330551 RepID=A0A848M4Q2_PAELE|nr:glycosyltransferase [Paenibacillus lemnae]NMO95239.1 glycosyltransferase [Paenibacillus lemnae]